MEHDIQYPLYRDDLFSKAKRLADYEKAKVLHRSICWQIERAEGKVEAMGNPRNKRQDILQNYDKHTIMILERQKTRVEERMKLMEEQIQKDIAESEDVLAEFTIPPEDNINEDGTLKKK